MSDLAASPSNLAQRSRDGDRSAEAELVQAFTRGIRVVLRHIARDTGRRFYLGQEDKDALCAELGVDRLQFNRIVHRARERFRELWDRSDNSGGSHT